MSYQDIPLQRLKTVAEIVSRKHGAHVGRVLHHTVLLMDMICQQSAAMTAHKLITLEQMGEVQTLVNNHLRQIVEVAFHKLRPEAKTEVYGLMVGLANEFSDAMQKSMLEKVRDAQAKHGTDTNQEVKAEDGKQG